MVKAVPKQVSRKLQCRIHKAFFSIEGSKLLNREFFNDHVFEHVIPKILKCHIAVKFVNEKAVNAMLSARATGVYEDFLRDIYCVAWNEAQSDVAEVVVNECQRLCKYARKPTSLLVVSEK